MENQQRVMPHSVEAERSLLGCMLLSQDAAYLAREVLTAQDFYVSSHKEIYGAMVGLQASRKPIDLVTLVDELNRRGTLEGVGGAAYLVELSRYVPSTANASAYAKIIQEKSLLRKLIDASTKIAQECYSGRLETEEILQMSEKLIYNIAMRRAGDELTHINETVLKVFDDIEQLYLNKGMVQGVPSGFPALDDLTTGFHGGEFILIGARPSMGKSSLMMNIVEYAAIKRKSTVAVFSLEMPREQLVQRLLCSYAFVNMQNVRQGNISDQDWEKLAESMGPLAAAPIYIDDTSGISVSEMRSRCRKLQIEHGLDLVVVDYLQLMSANRQNESRQNEISEISRMLKGLAKELNVPVIALSQLSRSLQSRQDHRPILSDLRDSGAIEQDADLVMFIHREEYYNKETEEKNVAELILAKQRNGPLGTVKLAWLGEYTKFVTLPAGYTAGA